MLIRPLPQALRLLLIAMLLSACSVRTRKLDEAVFHEGPQFTLKLVRYHENFPFHYVGEVYRVHCGSAATAQSPGHRTQDPGWVTIGQGGAIGSTSAAELVQQVRQDYHIIDASILAWTGNGLNVSFDACGSFRSWYPMSLPGEMIASVDRPEYCAPVGKADCRFLDFQGERTPRFESIAVSPNGRVSFVARSPSILPRGAVRIESADSGQTWIVTPL